MAAMPPDTLFKAFLDQNIRYIHVRHIFARFPRDTLHYSRNDGADVLMLKYQLCFICSTHSGSKRDFALVSSHLHVRSHRCVRHLSDFLRRGEGAAIKVVNQCCNCVCKIKHSRRVAKSLPLKDQLLENMVSQPLARDRLSFFAHACSIPFLARNVKVKQERTSCLFQMCGLLVPVRRNNIR